MSLQQLLTALVLPPIGLVLLALAAVLVGRRGLAAMALLALLALATPLGSGLLRQSLESQIALPAAGDAPGAIIVLGADLQFGPAGAEIGPMTLERLRTGAALHRATGLPLLVTGGVLHPDAPALALLMARSLIADFATPPRWVEPRAANTRENAAFSAAMLRGDGIEVALVVSHGWHLPRALALFARAGFRGLPAPLQPPRPPGHAPGDFVPRAELLGASWFALREWAGRAVDALRD
jgi:uncharacterized SAM-binding protein YcdF (DUF218 family)